MRDTAPLTTQQLKLLVYACANIARSAARDIIMPAFGCVPAERVRRKTTERDVVTDVDEQAETFITSALHLLRPEALIVGEEAAARHPELLQDLATAPLAFTVDPIDGTLNFVEGVPAFGVMIAIVSYGEAVASVILDPTTGRAAMACRGAGAWQCDANGREKPLRYASPPQSGQRLCGKLSWAAFRNDLAARSDYLSTGFEKLWDFRCASVEYYMAAAGFAHVLFYRQVMPWDHCPGWILIKEAGGYGATLDDRAYRVGRSAQGLLYAPDRQLWSEVNVKLGLSKSFAA